MGQRRWKSAWPLAVVGVVSMLGVPGIAGASAAGNANPAAAAGSANGVTPVCPGPSAAGFALCRALLLDNPASWRGQHVTGNKGPGPSSVTVSGYGPADLQSAYSLPSTSKGVGETVAIVDAYGDPNAYSDLTTYRSKFGLPTCLIGTCFHQVNQSGGTSLPRGNSGWAEEISLDLDMVSAVCPNCNILLVEASSSSFANLAAAEDTARRWAGVVAISNSYGGSEFSGEASYDSHYSSTNAAITVSSGDGGYGTEYPAASPYVTAVGGTSLTKASGTSRGWTETAWSGAGSGCSAYEPRPSSQSSAGIPSTCSNRAVADVSADADPNTGVAVYDSYRVSGWLVFGGTSVASPLVASVYALAGNTTVGSQKSAGLPYLNPGSLNDVTGGSNGSCGGTTLCTAKAGWDGPTGLGTPNTIGAF
jgi:subtilase family serine protease